MGGICNKGKLRIAQKDLNIDIEFSINACVSRNNGGVLHTRVCLCVCAIKGS